MCYSFGDIKKFENSDFDNIFIDEKPYENTLVYNISYKTLIGPKGLHVRLDKIDGFIRVYEGTRFLVLFLHGKYDAI